MLVYITGLYYQVLFYLLNYTLPGIFFTLCAAINLSVILAIYFFGSKFILHHYHDPVSFYNDIFMQRDNKSTAVFFIHTPHTLLRLSKWL